MYKLNQIHVARQQLNYFMEVTYFQNFLYYSLYEEVDMYK